MIPACAGGSVRWTGRRIACACMFLLLAIGIGFWDVLVTRPDLLFVYAVFDLALLSWLLVGKAVRNEFALLFCALSILYSHSFIFEAVIGLTNPQSFAIVINLASRGLDLVPDSSAILLAAILFRNATLLGWWRRLSFSLGIGAMLASARVLDILLVSMLAIGAYVAVALTKISILSLLYANLVIFASVLVSILAARQLGFRLVPTMLVIMAAALVMLAVGRSRLPIMVVSLSLLTIVSSVVKPRVFHQVLLGTVLLVVFLGFGYLRESVADRGTREGTGVLSLEETGNMHLVGAHLVGIASRGQLPSELRESVLAKILRAVPGSGGSMLADRYIWSFFPEIAASGGGFAYPAIAEWFVVGGVIGVAIAGCLFGVLAGALLPHVRSGFACCLVIIVLAQFFRQELAATLLTIVALLLGSFAIVIIKQVLAFNCRAEMRSPDVGALS